MIIFTPTVKRNLAKLKLALETSCAVLVQGEVGCGKSISIQSLAEQYGAKETMVLVNVDDTFDSKDLLGKFSATDTPGLFEWVAGPLTRAVEKGFWILMEDIDLASFDVFSVLLCLLENGTLFLSDKNSTIHAHPNFKLIATQQLVVSGESLLSQRANSVPFAELWGTVIMECLPPEEVCTIVQLSYESVPSSVATALASLNSVVTGTPLVTLRSLLQWSQRVNRRLKQIQCGGAGVAARNNNFISSTVREIMLREAFDCIVARYMPGAEQNATLAIVAGCCGVPENVAQPLVLENKPQEARSLEVYTVGRVSLPLTGAMSSLSRQSRIAFAPTRHALSLLERLAASIEGGEHVLLTGETGVGKTFIIQYLADQVGQELIVHNLNQQTDTSDFMGGWKPLDVGVPARELYHEFTNLFSECFNPGKNVHFLALLQQAVSGRKWERAIRQILKGCATFAIKREKSAFSTELERRWQVLDDKSRNLLDTVERTKTNFAFFFEEGSLVKAWREGHWILLDEVNLATTEVLERVSSVLGDVDKLFLTDKGDAEPIPRHKNFHVFANMNPPTDVGKKDLPPSLRSRFTEYYVSEPFNRNDINIVVKEYIGFLTPDAKVDEITNFFLDCVENAKSKLCALDGESKLPSFSLRTLTRALTYVRRATSFYGFSIALFDGLMLGFATPLQRQFHQVVEALIVKNIFRGKKPSPPRLPAAPNEGKHIAYEHMWIEAGDQEPYCDTGFILTDSVKGHLTNLARAVFVNRPVLLEGPTSSGKSSMVKYLAELTGNNFVRINNHESTEVQEYLGHYVTDENGKLRFVDGILVTAVRFGYWVVLDELNLAPTDVLEALNRLLDDNCELFIPDTQETIKPHPRLRIFATQNPAGIYGGRKMLSRAFRNRFLEITVDDIPTHEISIILQKRYSLPKGFAEKMVEIMTTLQLRRQASHIFAGKHGFITPRDLFRWAERNPSTYQELAEHGFLLLGERCRKPGERQIVKDVMESVCKNEIDETVIYHPSHWPFVQRYFDRVLAGVIDRFQIVWTESMQRLFTMVGICLEHQEPVLLVGETGSSKTTVCQLWAALLGIPLHILNCHQHTEAADFLGSLRPVPPDRRHQTLFEWCDGPLVQSMIHGDCFVLDEISLTEDSVLERLNSVLEPLRSVVLAEKSTADCITAHEQFRIMATMNPGGDYGKKELSPALRNRFTEIYVRPITDEREVSLILSKRLDTRLEGWAAKMAAVLCHVSDVNSVPGTPQHISIRDIIGWVSFMNATNTRCSEEVAFMQGLDAVILDGMGVGTGQSEGSADALRSVCLSKAKEVSGCDEAVLQEPVWNVFEGMCEPQLPQELQNRFCFHAPTTRRNLSKLMRASILKRAVLLEGSPGVGKTSIVEALGCALGHPVVRINLSEQTDIMDLFGTYLPCPVSNCANGGDAEIVAGPQFVWSDGVLLRALKDGSWVILDELNLASQTVLEGLNALLDHRSTVCIPELNAEFHAHDNFCVFACQNPLVEGGGRKGLPRSFLNRFIKVRVEAFEMCDLISITSTVCPDIEEDLIGKMVGFVGDLHKETMVRRSFGIRGGPWEFNLRDVLRWAHLMRHYNERTNPTLFSDLLFLQRMRTSEDRARCQELLEKYFCQLNLSDARDSDFLISGGAVYFEGRKLIPRGRYTPPTSAYYPMLLPSQTQTVKALLMCAELKQFVLLVGPSASGKTFTLRTAAALAGAKLVSFSINASCDTVDLLGGFDQVEGRQGQFEWRDSLVLEAMLQGHWLVLDNVNYCSASVLDRLNPLVEPNGFLSVNEQGLVDNEIRVVRPHPNFRLFATLNPKYGEISRSMRNRAVEVYVSPVAVPSLESLALCGAAAAEHHPSEEFLMKLSAYHNHFVRVGFHADSMESTSSQLSDALSVGAPNIFTLIRTATMYRFGTSSPEWEVVVAHRYLENRSGHWRYRRAELADALVKHMSASPVENAAYPQLEDAVAFMSLLPRASPPYDIEDAAAGDTDPLALILAHNRTMRSSAALRKALFSGRGPQSAADLLLHFILDQCSDGIPVDCLTAYRIHLVQLHVPGELGQRAASLLSTHYSIPTALPEVFCRTMTLVGPYAAVLSNLSSTHTLLTESPLLNSAAAHVLSLFEDCVRQSMPPLEFHRLVRVLVPFAVMLQSPETVIDRDSFIPVATRGLQVYLLAKSTPQLASLGAAEAVESFFEAMKRFLQLPFPLVGGKALLADCVPQPHVTTSAEREAYNQWRQLSLMEDEALSSASAVGSTRWLRPLWTTGAFRAEFHLLQCLLHLHLSEVSVAQLRNLQTHVRAFLERFTLHLPLFSELEMTLWKGILTLTPSDCRGMLAEFTPLLATRFVSRYGLQGARHLFPGSWAGIGQTCLRYASSISVVSVGHVHNDHLQTLSGLSSFLTTCPVLGSSPFMDWEQNARRELRAILQCCLMEVPGKLPLCREITPGDDTEAVLVRVGQEVLDASLTHLSHVESQRPLLRRILSLLQPRPPSACRTPDTSMLSVMVLLWSLKCRLLLPLSPVDPMYLQAQRQQVAHEQIALLNRLEGAFSWAEQLALRTYSPQTELIRTLRKSEEVLLKEASHAVVERPDSTGARYVSLVHMQYQICSTLLCDDRLFSVLEAAGDADDDLYHRRETWSTLLYEQVMEMLSQYGGYEDVTLNFAVSALLASLAARTSCYTAADDPKGNTLFDMTETLQLLQFPNRLVGTVPLPPITSTQLHHRLTYLDSCLTMLRGCAPQGTERSFVENVFSSYRALYKSVQDLEEQERAQEQMSVLYKEKAVLIDGDEEKLLQRLKSLFPSYESEFVDAMGEKVDDEDDNGHRSMLKAAKRTRVAFTEKDGACVLRLVNTHHHVYEHLLSNKMSAPCDAKAVLEAFQMRFDVLSGELGRYGERTVANGMGTVEEQLLLSGFAARVAMLRRDLKATAGSVDEMCAHGFNIFLSAEPNEVGQFSKPLAALLAAVDALAETYPETVSLQRCQRIGRKIAALPVLTTPLMKVMAGCEILLRECYEWERNASHQVSIMTHMTELSSFVLRWRRLELHCWPHVFKAKRDEMEVRAVMQWFTFYDLVHDDDVADTQEDHCVETFHRFSQYLWDACYGDFGARLRLVQAMGYELAATRGRYAPLTNVVLHIADYFAQFEPFIAGQMTKALQPIEEDISEFTKIMRWEDANYYAVRATSEKSHLKMARVLGEVEDALRTPILAVISNEEQRCEEDPSMGFALTVEDAPKKRPQARTSKGEAAERGGKRKRNGKKVAAADGAADASFAPPVSVLGGWCRQEFNDGCEFLQQSARDIVERVRALQEPKTPIQQKIRALKTFFDAMGDAAVPHTHVGQAQRWEVLFGSTEAILGSRTVHNDQPDSDLLESAASAHYRFARWLQRLRDAERKPHTDLSGAQVRRGTGIAESLFSHSVLAAEIVCLLRQLRHELTVLSDCVGACSPFEAADAISGTALLDATVPLCCELQSLYGSLEWMLVEHAVPDASGDRATISELGRETGTLWQLCVQHEPLRRSGAPVPVEITRRVMDALRVVHGICGRLGGSQEKRVAAACALYEEKIVSVMDTCGRNDILKLERVASLPKRPRCEEDSIEWPQQLQSLVRAVEVALVDTTIVSSPTEGPSDDPERDAEGGASDCVYGQYAAAAESFKASVADVLQCAQEAVQFHGTRALQASLQEDLIRRLRGCLHSVDSAQHAMMITLSAQAHFGLVVTRLFTVLVKKGFCRTEENEENAEGEGEGEQQNGTGMDDGEGEKDVTDQLENEDQLMNMKDKEEKPEEQKKDDDDQGDEDGAADVETDFQGQKENREESNENSDDEGEETEKEMGSVDGEGEQDRKKTKKDKGDDDDMSGDEGGDAEEVPEDNFGDEHQVDEETGGFDKKEDEVREAEQDMEGDHDLVADDKENAMSDEESDSEDGKSLERSNSDGDEKEVEMPDNEQETDEDEKNEAASASEGREDDEKTTDDDRSTQGEREVEGEEENDFSGPDVEEGADGPDENIFEGGQQDDEVGNEATERQDTEKTSQPQQNDAAGTDEEQAGNEQEQDDAGRSWKRQDNEPQQSERRDNSERTRAQRNPYRAVKQALQRHQQQVQQLQLDRRVELQRDQTDTRDDEAKMKDDKMDEQLGDQIDEYELDEHGEQEGLAATDDHDVKPTEAEAEPPESREGSTGEDSEEDPEAPEDGPRRRRKQTEDIAEVGSNDDEADKDATAQKKTKKGSKVKARHENEETDSEDEHTCPDAAAEESPDAKLQRGRQLWLEQEAAVQGLSQQLCEQLRLILAPTLADKLQGDYKSGKRLNMKRIIPYIASQFKKDRIWLRRTKPNKRTYQVMVALDDSLSMQSNKAGVLSCRAVALIAKALQQLEVGEVGITCFGKETKLIHALGEPFAADSGPRAFSEITFAQTSTNLRLFLDTTLTYLDEARGRMHGQTRSTTQQLQQILFIISDGQITEDRAELRKCLVRAEENHQMVVFVLLDIKASGDAAVGAEAGAIHDAATTPRAAHPQLSTKDLRGLSTAERMRLLKADRESRLKRVQSNSIVDMQLVEFKNGAVIRRPYMEDFPFPYYLVVRDLQRLPETIADAMRQWFELLTMD